MLIYMALGNNVSTKLNVWHPKTSCVLLSFKFCHLFQPQFTEC